MFSQTKAGNKAEVISHWEAENDLKGGHRSTICYTSKNSGWGFRRKMDFLLGSGPK